MGVGGGVGVAIWRRARWRSITGCRTVILVLTVSATAVAGAGCTGSGSAADAGRTGSRTVTEITLPTQDRFSAITAIGGHLVLDGDAPGPGCHQTSTLVDPARLTLGPVAVTPCDRPDFAGGAAAADLDYDPTTSTETFSVARHAGDGRFTVGPVLATFAAPAGDHPASTSANGSVWVWGTPVSGGGSEVTQISATTGAVVETVALPHADFGTPLMAADDDGLWLSLPPNTGNDASPTPVFFVPAGERTVRVTELAARAGWWMVAEGHQVWIDTLTAAGVGEVLWTAKGSDGALERLGSVTLPAAAQDGDDVATGGAEGLWTFDRTVGSDPRRCATTQAVNVVRVAPGRATRPVATFEVPVITCHAPLPESGAAVYLQGRLYVMDGENLYKVPV